MFFWYDIPVLGSNLCFNNDQCGTNITPIGQALIQMHYVFSRLISLYDQYTFKSKYIWENTSEVSIKRMAKHRQFRFYFGNCTHATV